MATTLEAANAALRSAVETRLAGGTTMEVSPMVASLHGCRPALEAATAALADPVDRTRVLNSDGRECPPRQTGDGVLGGDPYSEWVAAIHKCRPTLEAATAALSDTYAEWTPPDYARREQAVAGFRRIVEEARPAREARAARRASPRLIGIAGRAGAGKDLVASMIPEARIIAFADPLYAMLAAMLGCREADLRCRDLKEQPVAGLGKSVRHLLQTIGTEWGRQHVAEDVWVRVAERRVNELAETGATTIVISGVRFENEAQWIRERGGEVWHVRRPGFDTPVDHASEDGVMLIPSEPLIVNDSTVDDLRRKVERALSEKPRPATDAPPITDPELAAMESRARLIGSANCWTGTGGSVAADSFRLIAEVRRLRAERDDDDA